MKIVLENKEAFVTLCDKLQEIKGVKTVQYGTDDFKNAAKGWGEIEISIENYYDSSGSWVSNESESEE